MARAVRTSQSLGGGRPVRARDHRKPRRAGEAATLSRLCGRGQRDGFLSYRFFFLLLPLLILPSCRATVEDHGRQNIPASYSTTTLSANLPSTVRVQAAIAAAESALRDRGYTIGERRATEDTGYVIAKTPNAGWLEKTTVRARLSGSGTRITVEVEPLGDQALSRAILDDILKRLGL